MNFFTQLNPIRLAIESVYEKLVQQILCFLSSESLLCCLLWSEAAAGANGMAQHYYKISDQRRWCWIKLQQVSRLEVGEIHFPKGASSCPVSLSFTSWCTLYFRSNRSTWKGRTHGLLAASSFSPSIVMNGSSVMLSADSLPSPTPFGFLFHCITKRDRLEEDHPILRGKECWAAMITHPNLAAFSSLRLNGVMQQESSFRTSCSGTDAAPSDKSITWSSSATCVCMGVSMWSSCTISIHVYVLSGIQCTSDPVCGVLHSPFERDMCACFG